MPEDQVVKKVYQNEALWLSAEVKTTANTGGMSRTGHKGEDGELSKGSGKNTEY